MILSGASGKPRFSGSHRKWPLKLCVYCDQLTRRFADGHAAGLEQPFESTLPELALASLRHWLCRHQSLLANHHVDLALNEVQLANTQMLLATLQLLLVCLLLVQQLVQLVLTQVQLLPDKLQVLRRNKHEIGRFSDIFPAYLLATY